MKVISCHDENSVYVSLLNYFLKIHTNSTNRTYIIPGGSTPLKLYRMLSEKVLDWNETSFLMSDERLCKINDPKSNYYSIKKHLLDLIQLSIKPDLVKIPSIYYSSNSSKLKSQPFDLILKNIRRPRLCILGIGDDCHTASLFPFNNENFNDNNKNCFFLKNPGEDFNRMTLSYEYLMSLKGEIIFLAIGKNKTNALNNCINAKYDPKKISSAIYIEKFQEKITIFADDEALREVWRKIKAIVFDFDGVIKDSVDIKTDAFRELYKQYGDDIVKKVIEHHHKNGGVSRFKKIEYYHKEYLRLPLKGNQIDEIASKFSNIVLNKVIKSNSSLEQRNF